MAKKFICFALLLLTSTAFVDCSSPRKGALPSVRPIHRIVPYNLHVRRPAVLGADPGAGPGGPDYRTSPAPNERFDCEPYDDLLKGIRLQALRQCLETLKDEVVVSYRLRRDPAPLFQIERNEAVPPCIIESLPEIPLPREIIFQSDEEGSLGCYASRLDIEADEVLWVKVPKARAALTLTFSQGSIGTTKEDFMLQFLSWIVAPFRDAEGGIPSRVLPDALCKRCMGEDRMVKEAAQPIVLWP